MIKRLRFKFIKITMSSVLAVLLLIIASVNIVNVIQNNRSVDMVTQIIVENGGTFKKNDRPFGDNFRDEQVKNEKPNDRFHNRDELPFSTRFFSVFLDENKNITEINSESIASVTDEDIKAITQVVLDKNKASGWYKTYRYRISPYESGFLLVVMEETAVRNSMLTVLFITLSVGVGAFFIIFLLIALFSKRAIKPIAQTYEKQKQFITDASHELKTPLTVVSANNEILAMTYGENEWCDSVEKQIALMRSLISQMIQMSRLDEDEQVFNIESFNISDAVYDTVMSFKTVAERKSLNMTVGIEPDILFSGDEKEIRHAIAVLADNAVKYCDKDGEIKVSVSKNTSGVKKRILITFENTYAYASSLDTDRIFERFYRADKARNTYNSFGLGLPIARSVIEKHGGSLKARKGKNSIIMEIIL